MALSLPSGVYRMASFLPGFILLEVAFAILILGIIGTLGVSSYRTISEHKAYSTTEKHIEHIFMALANHAKRTGSIPCPASPESSGVGANQGTMGCPQLVGLVPYETLGISERETNDGWQRPITYAMDQALHPSQLDIQSHESVLGPFCEATLSGLTVTHNIGQPTTLHPAVILISQGPTGSNSSDPSKAYNAALTSDFVDQSIDSTFDDIVRFVSRDHLLAFYGQSGCPTQ